MDGYNIFKSRKFWGAIAGLVVVLLDAFVPDFPFSGDQVANFILVVVAYIGGVALEDGLAKR